MKLSKVAILGAVTVFAAVVAFNVLRPPPSGSVTPADQAQQGQHQPATTSKPGTLPAVVDQAEVAGAPVRATAQGFSNPVTRAAEVERLQARGRTERQEAVVRAGKEGWGPDVEKEAGPAGLMAIRDGRPYVFITHNANAGISIAVDQVRNRAPYSLTGEGETVGIWDAGQPLGTHRELTGRVEVMDAVPPYWHSHSSHVGGTIGASGVDPNAIGMAPAVLIDAYDWVDDLAEMASRAMADAAETNMLQISNHSYGPSSGWTATTPPRWYGTWGQRESEYFGLYDADAVEIDNMCFNAPFYLPFLSSGNDRGDAAPVEGATFSYYDGGWQLTTYNGSIHPYSDNWDGGGYDTVPIRAVAKNVMTVSCVRDAVSGGIRSLAGATMPTYPSWGPTDDGRVKPDLVANGDGVYSLSSLGNSSYYTLSGSSMSVAAASGSAILLTEYYNRLMPGRRMLASTIKGLMINTADDIDAAGPDYKTGWGLVNAGAACEHLRRHVSFPELGLVREDSLSSTNISDSFTFIWTNSGPIKVTLCWTDPAGPGQTGMDSQVPALVNDLDLRIVDPSGATNCPFVLNPAQPSAVATNGDNRLDNVEQLCITSPATAGEYVVTVAAHGAITGAFQQYSLLIGGVAVFPRIEHSPPGNTSDVTGPYVLEADIVAVDGFLGGSPALLWNTNGSPDVFVTNAMIHVTNDTYRGEIPGFSIGTTIYYLISVGQTNGLTSTSPAGAPSALHRFEVVGNMSLLIGGSPLETGEVVPAYGTTFWPSGNTVRASAALYDTPVAGHRHMCDGWVGLGSAPASGSSNSVGFMLSGFSALVWRWTDQYALTQTSSVSGLVNTQIWWASASTGNTVTAAPVVVRGGTNYCLADWHVDGVRAQDGYGVAVNPVTGIMMGSPRSAVAGYLWEDLDADTDGLQDWWEVMCFASTASQPFDDDDGDEATNLQEFRDRSNPRDIASVPMPPVIRVIQPTDPTTSPAPWIVSASITDNCSVASATLYWSRNGGGTTSAAMSLVVAPDLYSGAIPPPGTNGDSFACWVGAIDAAGSDSMSAVYTFSVLFPIQIVDPTPLPSIGLMAGASTNVTIAITNAGQADLVWSLTRRGVGLDDDMESGTNGWTHSGTNDLWHISIRRGTSPTNSWYCGSDDGARYTDGMNASLVTPPLYVGRSAILTFSHWLKTEIDTGRPGHTWDAGIVEISTDGGTSFAQVRPVGGYNYLVTPNPASPFAAETPCYGGAGEWLRASFDLSAYAGRVVLIRYRFGSDAFVVDEGWYIDDVAVVPNTGDGTWLAVSPTNGVIPPGSVTNITLALDSAGLTNGAEVAELLVLRSNDPITPVSNIVVALGVGTPPVLAAGPARQTTTNGTGLVTISNAVSDAEGSAVAMEVTFSTNNGVSWNSATLTGVTASQAGAGVSVAGMPQVTGITTRVLGSLVTNNVATVWATTNDILGMRLCTNTLVKARAWDGYFWSDAAMSQPFMVDNEPPGMPSGPGSSTHTVGVWSTGRIVAVSWQDHASDGGGGGLAGYGYAFTNTGAGQAPGNVMTAARDMASAPLADGSNWWLRVRAVDVFGNRGAVTSSGPYLVDTTPPAANAATVTVLQSVFGGYIVGVSAITGTWSGFMDSGSGIAGYYYSPTNGGMSTDGWWTVEAGGSITGVTLNATNRIHVWAKDNLGLVGTAVAGAVLVLGPDDDWDGDLQKNSQEEIGGSDARNPTSVFRITGAAAGLPAEGYGFRLAWQGVAGRLYTVYSSDRMGDAWTPDSLFSNVSSSGGVMIYTNTAPASNRYFRVRIGLP
ncbi:MAG: S8 family serine peptidase [bacterium]